jgi:hypothetical protein
VDPSLFPSEPNYEKSFPILRLVREDATQDDSTAKVLHKKISSDIDLRRLILSMQPSATDSQPMQALFDQKVLAELVKNPHPKGAALKNPPIGGTRPCPQRGRAQ